MIKKHILSKNLYNKTHSYKNSNNKMNIFMEPLINFRFVLTMINYSLIYLYNNNNKSS